MESKLQQYYDELTQFDWQYEFSDDHNVWLRGKGKQAALFAEATQLGTAAMELYFGFVDGVAEGRYPARPEDDADIILLQAARDA